LNELLGCTIAALGEGDQVLGHDALSLDG
jgi:hypothetical protein